MASYSNWFAALLDLRCPNCGRQTAGTLFWRCGKCHYPSRSKIVCPNCLQRTCRTRDGLCRLCGHPLKHGIYEEVQSDFVQPAELITAQPEEKLPAEAASPPQPEPAVEQTRTVERIDASAVPEAPPEIQTPAINTLVPEPRAIAPVQPVEQATEGKKTVFEDEIAKTAGELAEEFKADPAGADGKYRNRLIKVKGLVETISTGEGDAAPEVILSSLEQSGDLEVSCVIDKKYAGIVKRLTAGQRLALLGRYNGYDTVIHLADCQPVG